MIPFRHFAKLEGKLGFDWGVCTRLDGPRFALLTFEHQAGFGCFEAEAKTEHAVTADKDCGS